MKGRIITGHAGLIRVNMAVSCGGVVARKTKKTLVASMGSM
jgi:hypothetical protein